MDIQFWIWLIIIVITLIARATRKKPTEQPRQGGEFNEPGRETGQKDKFSDLTKQVEHETDRKVKLTAEVAEKEATLEKSKAG